MKRFVFAVLLCAGCGAPVPMNPDLKNPPPRTVRALVTGEEFAVNGYAFPPGTGQEIVFQDGWEVKYSRVLVTVGAVHLSANPDLSPTDQSKTGEKVAQLEGPWAVDLSKEESVPLAVFASQNLKGNQGFDPSAKYAFGYTLVKAVGGAKKVNLDVAADADYAEMVTKGYATLMVGEATFKGTNCRNTVAGYDFGRLPRVVRFKLGFKSPVEYRNCLNPSLGNDKRGVQIKENAAVDAEASLHLDHPFWEALTEDAPLRFDLIAARKSVATGMGGTADVTMEDLSGLDFQAGKDAQGIALPWRYCNAAVSNERLMGTVSYDPGTVPVNAAGGAAGLKDLADFMTWNQSTFGHLNGDGLCFPARDYPSP